MMKTWRPFKANYRSDFEGWLQRCNIQILHRSVRRSTGGQCMTSFMSVRDEVRELVIVFHSTGCDRFMPLLGLYRCLLESGLNVMAIDLDGHGLESTSVFDSALMREQNTIVQDLYEQCDVLQEYEKVHLLGQSLGGCVAIDCLARSGSPQNINKVIVVGMPLRLDLKRISFVRESFDFISPTLWRSLFSYGVTGVVPLPGSLRRRMFPIRTINQKSYLTEIIGYINQLSVNELVSRLSKPVLNVYGGLDSIAQDTVLINALDHVTPCYLPFATHYSILYSNAYFDRLRRFIGR